MHHRDAEGTKKTWGCNVRLQLKGSKPLLVDIQGPLLKLLQARQRAESLRQPAWDHALDFAHLQQCGLTEEALRWLWHHGYRDCVVARSKPRTAVRPKGSFHRRRGPKQPWVVLTPAGAWFFRLTESVLGDEGVR